MGEWGAGAWIECCVQSCSAKGSTPLGMSSNEDLPHLTGSCRGTLPDVPPPEFVFCEKAGRRKGQACVVILGATPGFTSCHLLGMCFLLRVCLEESSVAECGVTTLLAALLSRQGQTGGSWPVQALTGPGVVGAAFAVPRGGSPGIGFLPLCDGSRALKDKESLEFLFSSPRWEDDESLREQVWMFLFCFWKNHLV